ncbi:hypothetical protein E2562_014288 [Oryza meyeriana var. granulata]|uniref:Uncharacterized protein n=1 Tax=Oryza meyeriana var. granulata TaxID=110450 RepID=A0A6G1C5Z4_9ORYZ|nr:hypothetical protein E2562_014288 [Oryza meyeriana var. granulata]
MAVQMELTCSSPRMMACSRAVMTASVLRTFLLPSGQHIRFELYVHLLQHDLLPPGVDFSLAALELLGALEQVHLSVEHGLLPPDGRVV